MRNSLFGDCQPLSPVAPSPQQPFIPRRHERQRENRMQIKDTAMLEPDVRWKQRLANYRRALAQLNAAVDLAQSRELSELERQGLIQSFEFTHELASNVMKDYFAYQGNPAITGSRDAAREAFSKGLIEDGEGWMEMIQSRNQTTHTYNEQVAAAIATRVQDRYRGLFQQFLERMESLGKC